MGGARIAGQRFFHQPDALVGAAQIEEGEALEVTDVVALGQELKQLLIDTGGFRETARLMESHRVVEGGLRVGELHVLTETISARDDQRQDRRRFIGLPGSLR